MPLTAEETLALADAWTAPISLAAPSGVSAKEDARYLAVTAGVARLDAVADEPIDWQAVWGTVITQGGGLLREKSKDITIASMVAHALLRRDHLEGLLVGVALLTALIERFWPTLFPELRRIKGRTAAVQWFIDASEAHLRAYTPASSDRDTLDSLAAAIVRLGQSAREKYGDSAPSTRKLRDVVELMRFEAGPLRERLVAADLEAGASAPSTTPWGFDGSNASLELFVQSALSGRRLRGHFSSFRGRVYTREEAGVRICGLVVTFDVASLSMADSALVPQLLSPECLDAASFPTARCALTGGPTRAHGDELVGEFTLHGHTKPVAMNDLSLLPTRNPQGRECLSGAGGLRFLGTDFGLARSAPLTAGRAVIGHEDAWYLSLLMEAYRVK